LADECAGRADIRRPAGQPLTTIGEQLMRECAMATERSAQLGDYSLLLRRQWWVVVAALAVTLGLAFAYTAVASPEYTSTTSVLVTPIASPSDTASNPRSASTINMDTEAQIITSTEVVTSAAQALGYAGGAQELAGRVTITVPPNTEILDISYAGPTASEARRGAEAFAAAYLANRESSAKSDVEAEQSSIQARINDVNARLVTATGAAAAQPPNSAARAYNEAQASSLNNQLSGLSTELNALKAFTVSPGKVITKASLPTSPSSPKLMLSLAAGALLGLLGGVGLAVLRERSDRYVRRASDVHRRADIPLLAEMPGSMALDHVVLAGAASPEGRSYSRLRNVVTAGAKRDSRVVLVAGVSGHAGPVAANLAASLARSGNETVLVCGDVHAETEAELLGGSSRTGLAEVLAGRATAGEALRSFPALRELRVLGPGGDRDLAAELLQTSGPSALLADLLEAATWVVIEAPATTIGADAQTLARFSDLAVLVVQINGTAVQEVFDARAQFESMGTPVLGAVVVPPQPKERGRGRTAGIVPVRTKPPVAVTVGATASPPAPAESPQRTAVPRQSPVGADG
jgi:capsular polysaccharide biosynthesis protein